MYDFRLYATLLDDKSIEAIYNNGLDVNSCLGFIESNFPNSESSSTTPITQIAGNFTEIDAPLSNMKIKTLPDRTAWARIHSLDLTEQSTPFTDNEVANCDEFGKYSKMGLVDEFKENSLNNYEFMLTYPSINATLPSEYVQLEYVEADGRQWINTGVTDKARWEFDIQFPKDKMPIIPKLTQNNE
jgi:hypothetical protein